VARLPSPLRCSYCPAFDRPEHESRWGVKDYVDAMLEHAVMHPIRHAFQLEGWLAGPSSADR